MEQKGRRLAAQLSNAKLKVKALDEEKEKLQEEYTRFQSQIRRILCAQS
jgi:FtsZ-binding cell division protein ZapB